jgi:hypothetical protein
MKYDKISKHFNGSLHTILTPLYKDIQMLNSRNIFTQANEIYKRYLDEEFIKRTGEAKFALDTDTAKIYDIASKVDTFVNNFIADRVDVEDVGPIFKMLADAQDKLANEFVAGSNNRETIMTSIVNDANNLVKNNVNMAGKITKEDIDNVFKTLGYSLFSELNTGKGSLSSEQFSNVTRQMNNTAKVYLFTLRPSIDAQAVKVEDLVNKLSAHVISISKNKPGSIEEKKAIAIMNAIFANTSMSNQKAISNISNGFTSSFLRMIGNATVDNPFKITKTIADNWKDLSHIIDKMEIPSPVDRNITASC